MEQTAIYLVDELPDIGSQIHRPPDEISYESYGIRVQWTKDKTVVIPWSQIVYVAEEII